MKWEYKTIKVDTTGLAGGKLDEANLDQILNALGDSGWEVVAAFDTNAELGASRHVVAILKRPKN
jgi:hypothetical protein